MKKNNVAVDIINFGEETDNTAKLEAFVSAVNSGDNSHLVTIPPGPHILSDILISSPIIAGEDGVPSGFATGGGSFEFGVDPNLDPELAMALRISLDEERARQEAEAAKSSSATANQEKESSTMAVDQTISGGNSELANKSEDELLSQALAVSMGSEHDVDVPMEELTEDEQIARAIEMSMQGGDSDEFMNSVLQSLPGVDTQDPRIRSVLQQGSNGGEHDKGKEDSEKKGKEKDK